MLIHDQMFYHRNTGEAHRAEIIMDFSLGMKHYDVFIDCELIASEKSKLKAFEELVDYYRFENWTPINPGESQPDSGDKANDFTVIWNNAYDIYAGYDYRPMCDYLDGQVSSRNITRADAESIAEDVIATYNL